MSSASSAAKIKPAAIIFGWLADVTGTAIAAVPLLLLFGVDPTDAEAVDRLTASTPFLAATLPVGLLFTVVGGYVGAHLARGEELNNAFLVGIASAITSLLFALGASTDSLWYVGVSVALTVPAALLGGYVRAKTRG